MTARLLIIALDGADGPLLDRLSADGTLPNIGALRSRGSANALSAPAGVTDDGLWASFQYASGLGDHGRYNFQQRLADGRMGMAFRDETDRETFWDRVAADGHRVAVFDVPKCRPPRAINGIHLADWLVHGRYFSKPLSYPDTLAGDVVERFGAAPPSRCGRDENLDDAGVLEVAANLETSLASKRAAALHYLSAEPWDLFIVGFKEIHCAGHLLWDLVDSHHPLHDAARVERLGDPFAALLRKVDAAVGDLVAAAGQQAGIVLFSTTGMEPNATLVHLMPEIVRRLNAQFGPSWLETTANLFRRRSRRRQLCEILPYNENCVALRVNHRDGFWQATKKSAIVAQIDAVLRDLRHEATGEKVVSGIDRPSASQAGARRAALPDLLVHLVPGVVPRSVRCGRLGTTEAELPRLRTGNHAAGGFVIRAGKTVAGAHIGSMQEIGPLAQMILRAPAPRPDREEKTR